MENNLLLSTITNSNKLTEEEKMELTSYVIIGGSGDLLNRIANTKRQIMNAYKLQHEMTKNESQNIPKSLNIKQNSASNWVTPTKKPKKKVPEKSLSNSKTKKRDLKEKEKKSSNLSSAKKPSSTETTKRRILNYKSNAQNSISSNKVNLINSSKVNPIKKLTVNSINSTANSEEITFLVKK